MSAILDLVRATLNALGEDWHEYLLRTQKLDIRASGPLDVELSRTLAIDRKSPGLEDFDPQGVRAIEPGNPARSLLYHALASPDVLPKRNDGSPIADTSYPTWDQLDVIENYIYSLASFSDQDPHTSIVPRRRHHTGSLRIWFFQGRVSHAWERAKPFTMVSSEPTRR
jgi:hypothetical protein